jgi:serine/threonine protein kinase
MAPVYVGGKHNWAPPKDATTLNPATTAPLATKESTSETTRERKAKTTSTPDIVPSTTPTTALHFNEKEQDGNISSDDEVSLSLRSKSSRPNSAKLPRAFSASLERQISNSILVADLKLGNILGSGNFSIVYDAMYNGERVAVKKQQLQEKNIDKYMARELDVLKTIAHPHLLCYIGATLVGQTIYVVTEFMAGGDLRDLLIHCPDLQTTSHQNNLWHCMVQMLLDVTGALAYLHDRELMHRDIKTQNIVLDGQLRAVLCDFGFARKASSSQQMAMTICGTDEFMAPEIIFGMDYGLAADIFSMGIVACEMCCRKAPDATFMVRTPQNGFGLDLNEVKSAFCGKPPASLVMWIEQCCANEPDDRLNAVDAEGWLQELLEEIPKDENVPVLDVSKKTSDGEDEVRWVMKNVLNNIPKTGTDATKEDPSGVDDVVLDDGTATASQIALPQDMHINPSQDFFIDINRLELGREIGSGQFSCVFEGAYEGARVAVKKQILTENRTIGKYLRQELAVSTISYVLRFVGSLLKN